MNLRADICRASTGTEMVTFPPFPSSSVLDPSSVDDPPTKGAPYSAKIEPVRSDTSDPRTRVLQASVKTLRKLPSSEHVYVLFRASPEQVYVCIWISLTW